MTVQVSGMASTGSPRPTRWPRGLIAAAACSAPCPLRTGGPQLSRLRGQRCMSLAGPQPPRHPTSALPIPVRPWRAAWQGHGAHACNEALHQALGFVVPAPPDLSGENTQAMGATASEFGVTCQLAALCRRNCDPIPLRRSRLGAAIASDR